MILFLHGGDTYRSRQKLKEITDKFKKEVDPQGYNLTILDGKECKIEQVIKTITTSPFLASKRMIVLEEYRELKVKDDEKVSLATICKNLDGEDTIFVVWETKLKKTDKKDPVIKALLKSKFILEFESYTQQQIAGWMQQQLQEKNITINQDAMQHLSISVADNLWKAASEVEKLQAYCSAKGLTIIDLSTVKLLITSGVEDDIFATVDAVSNKNIQQALKRLHSQFESGSHELQLLTMLFRQFRLLQQIKDGLATWASPQEVAKQYGIHPFVVKKMSNQARSISQAEIISIYTELLDADKQIKSSGLDGKFLLSKTVAKISS